MSREQNFHVCHAPYSPKCQSLKSPLCSHYSVPPPSWLIVDLRDFSLGIPFGKLELTPYSWWPQSDRFSWPFSESPNARGQGVSLVFSCYMLGEHPAGTPLPWVSEFPGHHTLALLSDITYPPLVISQAVFCSHSGTSLETCKPPICHCFMVSDLHN